MRIFTYDFEVFRYDWIGIFKDFDTHEYTVIHNDNGLLREFISEDAVYIGFNSKHYDQFIVKAAGNGAEPEELKELNDFIIVGNNQGWEHPLIRGNWFKFNNVDIMDDMQKGLSLKAIEGHLGMSIQETEVDFNLDRPLTEEELEQTITYCKHDVDATEQVVILRKKYLQNKINIGRLAGLDDVKAMGMTNAKLTAALLKAQLKSHDDERDYKYPDNLRREYIPQEVFDFFDKMKDESLSDKDVFSDKVVVNIGDCPVTIGYGGVHGAIPHYLWKEGCA